MLDQEIVHLRVRRGDALEGSKVGEELVCVDTNGAHGTEVVIDRFWICVSGEGHACRRRGGEREGGTGGGAI